MSLFKYEHAKKLASRRPTDEVEVRRHIMGVIGQLSTAAALAAAVQEGEQLAEGAPLLLQAGGEAGALAKKVSEHCVRIMRWKVHCVEDMEDIRDKKRYR